MVLEKGTHNEIYKQEYFSLFTTTYIFKWMFQRKKEETFKTVEYYIKNNEAREVRKKECMAMGDTTETISKDCANVDIAIRKTRVIHEMTDTSSWF